MVAKHYTNSVVIFYYESCPTTVDYELLAIDYFIMEDSYAGLAVTKRSRVWVMLFTELTRLILN